MTSDDLFGDVADRLLEVLEAFGDGAFREAALKASVAIARVALSEAEARARERANRGKVIPFSGRGGNNGPILGGDD